MTRDQLEQRQIPLYFLAVALAAVVGLLAPNTAAGLTGLVSPAIALLMYAMFLQIPFLDLRANLPRGRFMAALLLANFVLVPLLVWVGTRSLVAHPALLIGALLVLLTPCIDYVVVFTHLGKGDARSMLAATPVLLLVQLLLLPIYVTAMMAQGMTVPLTLTPFISAFLGLIALPLLLAVATSASARRFAGMAVWDRACAWLPVPAMALVLMLVVASQIGEVVADVGRLLPVLPVYVGFAVLAPCIGLLMARLWRLPVQQARALAFSTATRNSLVVLPLALALPPELRTLAAAAVMTQTLVELVAELIYVRLLPVLIRR
ncbi:arsenic resistance protein [Pseudomonas sp. MLB6B]